MKIRVDELLSPANTPSRGNFRLRWVQELERRTARNPPDNPASSTDSQIRFNHAEGQWVIFLLKPLSLNGQAGCSRRNSGWELANSSAAAAG